MIIQSVTQQEGGEEEGKRFGGGVLGREFGICALKHVCVHAFVVTICDKLKVNNEDVNHCGAVN